MNKRLLIFLCLIMLLPLAAGSAVGQEQGRCVSDVAPIQAVLANIQSADNNSDILDYLMEMQALLDGMIDTCNMSRHNWCYPGQPWGDGRCNGPDLTQDEIDWFWSCGMYWARYEAGQLDVVPGWCGYSPDSDGDGYADDVDQCPNQGGFVDDNGCPACDTSVDADCDGTPNSYDQCPNDPGKTAPGACGCGIPDTDGNGDGTPDCNDQCPADPNKVAPGVCGCGTADTDGDGDGTPDCFDQCPADPTRIAPAPCGCSAPDSDGDGVADCVDACPLPGDEPWNIGDHCKVPIIGAGPGATACDTITGMVDLTGNGCADQWSHGFVFGGFGGSSCTLSTPMCP